MKKVEVKKIEWQAPKNVRAYVTTRIDGFSKGKYKHANMSFDVGDSYLSVKKNRKDIVQSLDLPSEPNWMKQIHGTKIEYLKNPKIDLVADSSYTKTPGVVCAVLSADCVPLLFTDTEGSFVGVIHAGWRGLQKGLIQKFIKTIKVSPKNIIVHLGPTISAKNYKIRSDVYTKLQDISSDIFKKIDDTYWTLNLSLTSEKILRQEGVSKIFFDKMCTFDNSNLFYSYRRSNVTGRIASIIWLDNNAE
ncbi:MAG: hypothetical protein CMD88_03160 [Gammaproteobacteria bacterium]|nr:hypothetical protein [Gammaproteobacteria bacterium]